MAPPAGKSLRKLRETTRDLAGGEINAGVKEKRDREQEKRDREQERLDRLEELYDNGREALDEERYEQARDRFSELAKANGPQTDAALYWEAYADQRLGQRQAALAAIADLKARFPHSHWAEAGQA